MNRMFERAFCGAVDIGAQHTVITQSREDGLAISWRLYEDPAAIVRLAFLPSHADSPVRAVGIQAALDGENVELLRWMVPAMHFPGTDDYIARYDAAMNRISHLESMNGLDPLIHMQKMVNELGSLAAQLGERR